MLEFCKKYKQRFNIPFAVNSRPELINEEIAAALKNAGCFIVRIGVESGDEGFRGKYLNRRMSNDVIKRAFRILKAQGLAQVGFFIFG
ncbi:MAG TPA: radical SAM protein, partial [Campylobacterales bacterium]|nr:radical SAM protein [Campylobacterales bacterium]